ncbi:MAG: sodium:solute symporter family protein [Planctomycetaceae bacterium]|jgi:SSS family solute:Na+ symporter|nr:sodium:solute symporter family protein [Planctomycetaceae bacterium]
MILVPVLLTLLFFVVILLLAVWGLRRTSNVNDFFLGGHTLGAWFLAFSYGTAYFSAVIFVGFAGKFGWQFGLDALWVGIGNAIIGSGLAWIVLGKRTRRMTHNLNVQTMPEFFAARYETNGMKIIAALIIFIFLAPYSASVFTGLSYLFEIVFGRRVSFNVVLTVISAISFVYVTCGGYKAIARIDFVQGLIMFGGSLLMVYAVAKDYGGISAAATEVSKNLAERIARDEIKSPAWFILPSVVFMTSVGVWGLPQMVHKYYAIRDENEIKRGAVITTVFALVIGCAAYFTGAMTHLIEADKIPKTAIGGVNFDQLVPDMVASHLPYVLLAVILLLVLSASLSTLSSLVLVSSSAITIDLYKGYFNPKASNSNELFLMRLLCGVFILISYLIALFKPAWIVSLMSISWGAVAGSFLAPYLYGLFWKRTTKAGAYAGMLTGLLVSNGLYWYWFFTDSPADAGAKSPLAASIAMIIPLVVVPAISLITSPPKQETIQKAFNVTSKN